MSKSLIGAASTSSRTQTCATTCGIPACSGTSYGQDAPTTSELHDSKVDLMELEVLFAGAAHVPSVCADDPERREPGRPAFIRRMLDRGDTPLLHRPH
jgi:hypothetical protein